MPTEDVLVKRVPPHSTEAEQSLVGAMLYNPEAIPDVIELVSGEDFYEHQYGVIYSTLCELYQAGKPADVINLQNALKTKEVAPEIYSLEFLRDLLNAVFTSANLTSYARIVRERRCSGG